MPSQPPKRVYAGIAASAAAVLVLEIGLTRIFSYTIWYHFAYLTISVALLGFGGSGAVLAAWPRLRERAGFASAVAIVAELGVALCLLVVDRVALDPLAIASDPLQFARLMLYYLAVVVPFFAGGFLVVVPLMAHPGAVSRLYFWDLIGAGLACGSVVPLIWWLGTPVATALSTAGFAFSAIAYAEPSQRMRRGVVAVTTAVLALGVAITGSFDAAPTKFVSIFLAYPNAKLAFHRWTPINRVDVVSLILLGRRGATSLGHQPALRRHRARILDDRQRRRLVRRDVRLGWKSGSARLPRTSRPLGSVLLLEKPAVAAIGLGGGADVLNALRAGAASIVGIEINPMTVQAGRELFRDWNGDISEPSRCRSSGSGRAQLPAQPRGSLRSDRDQQRRYMSALSTGAYVLSESFLYTSDAVSDYLEHLRPNGIFAMAVGDLNSKGQPPRHTLRLASIVRRALENRGISEPARHVIVVASPGGLPLTHTLVKNEPFTAEEVAKVEAFATREGFELWHRPDQPVENLASKILNWSPSELERFYARHPLKLGPTTDDSPFFFNFYKWRTLAQPATSHFSPTTAPSRRARSCS